METIGTHKIHPGASVFPLLEGDAFESLVDDICNNGLHHPIIRIGGVVVDGRNRLRACIEGEVTPTFEDLPDDTDPWLTIQTQNLMRRDLGKDERASVMVLLGAGFQKEQAEKRMKEGASKGGRPKKGSENPVAKVPQGFPDIPERSPRTREVLAEQAGVGQKKIQSALNILNADPKIGDGEAMLREVIAGKVNLIAQEKKVKQLQSGLEAMEELAKPKDMDKLKTSGEACGKKVVSLIRKLKTKQEYEASIEYLKTNAPEICQDCCPECGTLGK